MSTPFQESQPLLARMTRAKKAQLLQWIVQDLGDAFPGIDSTPGILASAWAYVRAHKPEIDLSMAENEAA